MKKAVDKVDYDVSGLRAVATFPFVDGIRFPLIGQTVLIASVNRENDPSLGVKSSISVFSSRPAIVGFGCQVKDVIAKNILSTGEFVINVPSADLARKIWKIVEAVPNGEKEIQELGLTPVKSVKLSTPRIAECKAHLECSLDWTKKYGDEMVIFGRVLLASVDKDVVEAELAERYKQLKLFAQLDNGLYGVIKEAKQVPAK
ncbi:MAG: flavin reductase family protein [Candidatus Zixiibacteriota bacterium]|nr:MAG: flavin reductase family protein [candidate division Zixibacteria bacterium]